MTGAAILIGFGADLVFGDPRRGHPVALFGALALRVERLVFRPNVAAYRTDFSERDAKMPTCHVPARLQLRRPDGPRLRDARRRPPVPLLP